MVLNGTSLTCVRYTRVPYTAFRVGDIVEVSFGIIAVPTAAGKRCMKLVLRGLSLENSTFTTVSVLEL